MLWALLRLAGCAVVLSVLALGARAEAQSPAESPFTAGTEAFARGDYDRALERFLAARAAGAAGPAVDYNIAVCRFRLGDYAGAERDFAALAERFPSMAALARFNRGLALEALGRDRAASAELEAARDAGDPKIAALAAERLEQRRGAAGAAAGRAWSGLVDLGLGRDDNVALVDDSLLAVGQSADSALTELFGVASRRVATARGALRFDLSGYLVRYPDAADFDQDFLRAALAVQRAPGRWRLEAGPHVDRSTLGGADFERELGATLRAARVLGAGAQVGFTLVYDDIRALAARYAFVDGSRARLGLFFERAAAAQTLRLTVESESNDRAEASVSARRNRVRLRLRRDLSAAWSIDGAAGYRVSRYDRAAGPKERLGELELGLRRDLARGWSVGATYRHSRNSADLPEYSYDSDRFSIVVGTGF